jgi:UDP-glucose 4-epimerase
VPTIKDGEFVILGGASQIGIHIGEQLLDGGARRVVLFDNLSLGSMGTMQPLLSDPRCTFVRGDVLRLNDLFDVLNKAEGVFAVAGIMATSIGENPWMGIDVNIRGVQNTLEACRHQGVKKVVFSSSIGVYGALESTLTNEDTPLRWQTLPPTMTLYCASKVMGESLARLYQQQYGLEYVALRYSAVYGEHQHGRALMGKKIAEACLRARLGEQVQIEGDDQKFQDYIYVGDAARANLMAMEAAVTGESINICAGEDWSHKRIVEIIAKACNASVSVEYRESTSFATPPTTSRQGYCREKARHLIGWEPQVSIEEGISRVLRWIDQERNAAQTPN